MCNHIQNDYIRQYTDEQNNLFPIRTDYAVVKVLTPNMIITKEGPAFVELGQTFYYYINYSNIGSGPVTNVIITDTIPWELIFISSTPAPTSFSSGTYTWVIGSMSGNSSGTIVVMVKVNPSVANGT